jgi:NitT/TauT family transport system substrate-binding protein
MRRVLAATASAALVIGLAACGGDSGGDSGGSDGGSSSEGELQTVIFGVAPVAPTGALQVGVDQGFFEEEGIELDVQQVQGGAAVLPGVMAGDPQFATSNAITLLTARDQGLGVKIVSNWSSDKLPPEKGLYGVVVPTGSDIATLKDLEGKKVATNTLRGLGDFTVSEAARKAGANPDNINFVELPFPDMPAALESGSVDAMWVPEPFLSTAIASGNQLVAYTTQESVPGLASYVFTSEQLAKEDPDLLAAMTRALEKTLVYADEHTDEVQAAAAEITGLPLETLQASGMEAFGTDLGEDNLNEVASLMEQRGWIEDGDAAVEGLLP